MSLYIRIKDNKNTPDQQGEDSPDQITQNNKDHDEGMMLFDLMCTRFPKWDFLWKNNVDDISSMYKVRGGVVTKPFHIAHLDRGQQIPKDNEKMIDLLSQLIAKQLLFIRTPKSPLSLKQHIFKGEVTNDGCKISDEHVTNGRRGFLMYILFGESYLHINGCDPTNGGVQRIQEVHESTLEQASGFADFVAPKNNTSIPIDLEFNDDKGRWECSLEMWYLITRLPKYFNTLGEYTRGEICNVWHDKYLKKEEEPANIAKTVLDNNIERDGDTWTLKVDNKTYFKDLEAARDIYFPKLGQEVDNVKGMFKLQLQKKPSRCYFVFKCKD